MNRAAQVIYDKVNKPKNGQEVFFDPITLSVIAGILSIIFNSLRIYMLLKKNKNQSAGEVVHTNCYYQAPRIRRLIRKAVRRKLSKTEYAQHGNELCNAIIDYGAKADICELQSLYDNPGDVNDTLIEV